MTPVAGWRDAHVLQLLCAFRQHARVYLYGGIERFAAAARAAELLADKSEADIADMMRALMSQFALAIDTKAFHNEALNVDGEIVMVHVHLYETTAALAENGAGGTWHPDELRRFFEKIRKYRGLLLRGADLFFSRVQIPPKSVAHTQSKFYALRELYEQEKKAARAKVRSEIDETRFRVLDELLRDVPAPPRKKAPTMFERRPLLWSPKELDTMIEFLVTITLDMQQKGTSNLVDKMSPRLGRSEQSCVAKLFDMHKNYTNKSSYSRAAHLPDTIFDTKSLAHKIFNADWTDFTDPNVFGVAALKAHSLRMRERERKRRATAVAPSSVVTRKPRHSASHSEPPRATSGRPAPTRQSSLASQSRQRTKFVREVAQTYNWSEQLAHDICAGMHRFIPLYRSNQLKAFFSAVVDAAPGAKVTEVCFNGGTILKAFEKEHGGLESFGEVALGIVKPAPPSPAPLRDEHSHPRHSRDEGEADEVRADMNEDGGAEEPTASPFDLANSPQFSMSDIEHEHEHDDSSIEDDNPIDDDDDVDTLSVDSMDIGVASPPSVGFKMRRKGYPSGKSYGKSDELMKKVKAACESCHARKKKKKQQQQQQSNEQAHSGDDDDDDSDADSDSDAEVAAQQANTRLSDQWGALLQSVDARIVELEGRNRDLIERKEDRERREQRKQWRSDLQIEALSLFRDAAATNS